MWGKVVIMRWALGTLWLGVALSLSATSHPIAEQFEPQVSLLTPTELTLNSGNVEVHYAGENLGQPFLHFGVRRWLRSIGALNFYGSGRVGYTFRQGLHRVLFTDSRVDDSDSVRLHWLPISLTLVTEYESSNLTFLRPYFSIGTGSHLMHQRSNIAEVSSFFFLPFVSTGFGLSFLNMDRGEGDTLMGFNFGLSYQNTLSQRQPIRGWSLDFGFNLSL